MDNVRYANSLCKAIWNKLSPTESPQPTEEERKAFIHYGSSLTALELLMVNTFFAFKTTCSGHGRGMVAFVI
jgi:hypothetical protein